MRAALTAFLLLVAAPVRGQDAERPQEPAGAAAPSPPSAAKKPGVDAEFEPERPPASIALGPNGRGDVTLSRDVGWLRSGLCANLGLGSWIELVLRGDTLLLYRGFGGQSGIHAGVRLMPLSLGALRAGVELTIGQLFTPDTTTMSSLTTVRGEVLAGALLDWAAFYGRFALRGIAGGSSNNSPGWTRDEEVGVGVERTFRKRFILGAEAYWWARPGLSTLGQWRIRLGYAR